MYALGAISLTQLIQGCDSFDDLKESLEYAEDYGKVYDRWCREMQQKEDEKEASWKEFIEHYEDIDPMFEQMDKMWDDQYDLDNVPYSTIYAEWEDEDDEHHYTDEELQAAFDAWEKDRKRILIKIGKEAKEKNIPSKTMYKFIKEYQLTPAERTVFWLAYYKAIE